MNGLFEIVLEILVEGAAEAAGSKKVPLPARIALGAALVLFFYGIAALVLWCGVDTGNTALALLGAALFAGFTLLAAVKVRGFRRRGRK